MKIREDVWWVCLLVLVVQHNDRSPTETRSDGSESAFPVLATQLKSEDGGGPPLHSAVPIGASSLQPALRSPATHIILLRAAVLTPWRGRRQERCPRGGPPSATKPHRSVALHGLLLLRCTVQGNGKLPLTVSHGCGSNSTPHYGASTRKTRGLLKTHAAPQDRAPRSPAEQQLRQHWAEGTGALEMLSLGGVRNPSLNLKSLVSPW